MLITEEQVSQFKEDRPRVWIFQAVKKKKRNCFMKSSLGVNPGKMTVVQVNTWVYLSKLLLHFIF